MCSSKLRIPCAASVHYPALHKLLHGVYMARKHHSTVAEIGDHVFEDTVKVFRTDGEWERKPLKIMFSSESAIGGLWRSKARVFQLLLRSVTSNASIMDGPDNRRVLSNALCTNDYKTLCSLMCIEE